MIEARRVRGGKRQRARSAVLVGALAGTLAAYTAETAAGPAARTDPPPGTGPSLPAVAASPTGSSAPATEDRAAPPTGSLRLAFAGDIHFEAQLRRRLNDPDTALQPISRVLADADITFANLETAIATGGSPEPKAYTFRAPPSALDAVKAAGIDVISMGNNHAVDYGSAGLRETLRALGRRAVTADTSRAARSGRDLAVVGVGADALTAYAPVLVEAAGHRVAVVAASALREETFRRWTATDTRPGIASVRDWERVLAAVRQGRADADLVVVYLHWGIEGDSCPSSRQRSLARDLADAGADVVVGTHAHLLQGAGHLQQRDIYVAYGLGNFAFYTPPGRPQAESGVLTLTLDGRRVVGHRWTPARIDKRGLPVPLQGEQAARARERWERLRRCTDLRG